MLAGGPTGAARAGGPAARAASAPDNLSAMVGDGYVYDPHDGGVVVFGDLGTGPQDQTWLLRRAGWTNETGATGPSSRVDPAIAYDPALAEVLLFGGTATAGASLNDTWAFAGGNWTQLRPSTSPAAPAFLGFQQMTYDPALGTVVLVTAVSNGSVLFGGDNLTTYAYEGGGWTEISFQGVPDVFSPVYLGGGGLVVDPVNGALVLPNGLNESTLTYDVWTLASGRWTRSSGPALRGSGMIWADAPAPGGSGVLALGPLWFEAGGLALDWPTFLGNATGWENLTGRSGTPSGLVIPFAMVSLNTTAGGSDLLIGETVASTPTTGPALWRYANGSWSGPTTSLGPTPGSSSPSGYSWEAPLVLAALVAVVVAVVVLRRRPRRARPPVGSNPPA